MCPLELGEVFHIPEVVVVIASLLASNRCVVESEGDRFCNSFVHKFDPSFCVISLLVPTELFSSFVYQRVYR